jgi:hypothetical protein
VLPLVRGHRKVETVVIGGSMMQQTIDIPTPSGADTETVITALETAALYRSKGDGREAMRWLRRAAESAGEAGDDQRALSLSRVVADLHDELDAAPSGVVPAAAETTPEPAAQIAAGQNTARYPTPPSLRATPPAPSSSPRVSHPPPPSSRGVRPSSSPRASFAPRPSSRPSYAAAATSRLPAPSSAPSNGASTQAARTDAGRSGARHAARVAIEISTTKPGVFELRLLADGEAPRIGSSEALLVMLDPESQLLSR